MVHNTPVSLDEMRGQLITLDDARERLAETEPLTSVSLQPGPGDGDHPAPKLELGDNWFKGPLTGKADAYLSMSGHPDFQLTRQAVAQLGSECHIPRKGQEWMSPDVLEGVINFGLRGALDQEYKLLVHDDAVLGLTRQTITPFSNLALVDTITGRLRHAYGEDAEVLCDYKFTHDLETTAVRLIVPGHDRVIVNDRVHDDTWSVGIQLDNSLTGLRQTKLGGYLFRHWCTNGCYDVANATPGFSRRQDHTADEAYAWAAEQVDGILGGLDASFDDVQALTSIPVSGEVRPVLEDLFAQHSIPKRDRDRVINAILDIGGDMTMYDVQAAITQAANLAGLHPRSVQYLLTAGGHVAHASGGRCNADHPCRRLMPAGWVPSQPEATPAA